MNADDKRHMSMVASIGCIVCLRRQNRGYVPAEVHHILKGGRRLGHQYTLPLCPPHHRGLLNTEEIVSRHPWKREFEKRYGTESELLELTMEELDRVRGGVA